MFDLHGFGFGQRRRAVLRTDLPATARMESRERPGGAFGRPGRTAMRLRRSARTRGLLAVALAAALAAAPAAPASAETTAREVGLGVGSLMSTLLYGPAKLTLALGGSLVSGLAWAVTGGDADVARPIFYSAVRGDYLITPDHLTGKRSVEFVGRRPENDWDDEPESEGGWDDGSEGGWDEP